MSLRIILSIGCVLAACLNALAQDKLPLLRAGSQTYTNVTITDVTPTDIYFSHAAGMGTAKLKNLDADLQKRFNFNPTKAAQVEKQRAEENQLYRKTLAETKPPATKPPTNDANAETEIPQHAIHARSFLGHQAPILIVERWRGDPPDTRGKFVLLDFWATWCEPCRESIPDLNAFSKTFADKLVIIGLTDEPPEAVQRMTEPKIDYYVGTDRYARTLKAVEVTGIPHTLLVDPQGTVRFEGHPSLLTEARLQNLLEKYGQ